MAQPGGPVLFRIVIDTNTPDSWDLVTFDHVDSDNATWHIKNPPQTLSRPSVTTGIASIERTLPVNCGMGPITMKYICKDVNGSTFGMQIIVPEQYRDLGSSPYCQITVNGTDWYWPAAGSSVKVGQYQVTVEANCSRKFVEALGRVSMASSEPSQPQAPQGMQEP